MPKKVYKKKKPQSFFTKNGKELKSYQDYNAVLSIQENAQKEGKADTLSSAKVEEVYESIEKSQIQEKTEAIKQRVSKRLEALKETNRIKLSMASLGANVALILAVSFLITNNVTTRNPHSKYALFSSKPLTTLAASSRLFGGDPRAATIDRIFGIYNCPLEGKGSVFVREADAYNIPYWIVAAISFQESSCGKVTPQPGGDESYNAWGWGVWGTNVRTFESWEEGIRVVSRYLGDNFFSRGVTDTCEIMRIYTPPSDGSWCRGVNYFGDIIQNYKSPHN